MSRSSNLRDLLLYYACAAVAVPPIIWICLGMRRDDLWTLLFLYGMMILGFPIVLLRFFIGAGLSALCGGVKRPRDSADDSLSERPIQEGLELVEILCGRCGREFERPLPAGTVSLVCPRCRRAVDRNGRPIDE